MAGASKLKRVPLFPLAGLAVVLLAAVAAMWLSRSQAAANERVIHTLHAELAITRVLERARAIESNHRAFLIAGDPMFLGDMHEAIDGLWDEVRDLRQQTADNPVQQANIVQLIPILRAKTAFAEKSATLKSEGRMNEARSLVASGRGKILMDRIRSKAFC